MSNINTEEIYYCSYCGAANKKSAVCCCECKKNVRGKYRPVYDFLKNHMKDDLQGQLTDSIFSYIKNFLLSHAYGVVLSLLIVTAGATAVSTATPYIEKVSYTNTGVQEVVQTPVEEPRVIEEFTDEDWQYGVLYISSNYDGFVDDLRTSERYWESGHEYNDSVTELYAENAIPGYNYSGVKEMISNPISITTDFVSENTFVQRYPDENSLVTGGNFKSELAQTLHEDNYTVAEFNYVLKYGTGDYDYDSGTGGTIIQELVYRMVIVKYDGDWYLAEDKLISRTGI